LPEIYPNFTLRFPEEKYFSAIFLGRGRGQPLARGWAPGPPPAKSGLEGRGNVSWLWGIDAPVGVP